ncbi:cytochrome P450 20A1-like [Lytechinus variegatus]|uniref:cytochrome P450 20A1-like n=1 Tax=Lytechinus variegatus TaxID=7654 RepID=UPI001BB273B8|nr:cytochrome P450 20A1-like [Lytechinus variegatus]
MFDITAYAATFIFLLLGVIVYRGPQNFAKCWLHLRSLKSPQRATTVPGLDPSDPVVIFPLDRKGNLDEIEDAGSLQQFLANLHAEYGDIASFYFTDQLCISIKSPELFQEHRTAFTKPYILFKLLEPLFTKESIVYAEESDVRKRRELTNRCFGFQALQNFIEIFNEITEHLVEKISSLPPGEHIPLNETCLGLSLKMIMLTVSGEYFKDDKTSTEFKKTYDLVWNEIESRFAGDIPPEGSGRIKTFKEAKEILFSFFGRIINNRRCNPPSDERAVFIDVLIKSDYQSEVLLADLETYLNGGFHASGYLFAWALFFLAEHDDIQEKLYNHVIDIVGKTGPVSMEHVAKMTLQ